ncbi:MAG: UDP-glucose 4-epimerase GalE [Paracoccus sp. (in: a-proteobacteria)]|nr:UDP-glucose 4-epimerase GalE [Paracoccus sp. (in: a-proteobacteria)]
MSERTIFVTGGAGFIGSHTCKLLHKSGFTPVTYDDLSRGNRDAVRWGPLIEGDICDTDKLTEALNSSNPEAVIHFAALAYVGESVEQPADYYRVNVGGTQSLLDACRKAGVNNIIFSSSCATYGIPNHLPISEATPQNPVNPYGRTKLIGEQMLEDYSAAYGIKYVALRYFNASGADPDGEIGEKHTPETHLIPNALMAARGLIDNLSVFGDDYDTPDGTCIRDYIHVADLAEAHISAVNYLANGGKNTALNLGTGRGVSINDLLKSISTNLSCEVPTTIKPRRAGDPPALYADARRAREVLGFNPALSDIDTIVSTAAPFFKRA